MLDPHYVGPEHILLGLGHEGEGVAAKALTELAVSLSAVRQQVEELIGRGQQAPSGHIPFTPRAKKVLELSLREALQLGHNYIGTEHILLGILREGENVGAQVLVRMGTDLNRVRLEVIKLVGPGSGVDAPPEATQARLASGAALPRAPRTALRYDAMLAEVRNALAGITERLTAIERHLGMPGPAEGSADVPDDGGQRDDPPGGKPDEPPGDVTPSGE